MKRKNKVRKIPPHTKWEPFYRCTFWQDGLGNQVDIPAETLVLRNNIYTVTMDQTEDAPPFGSITWLSIKRNDRQPIHDWRDLQRIKNECTNPEREAVEIYPAESRLTDTSNQYHLWVFPEGFKIPFGYAERMVMDETTDPGTGLMAKQRPFKPGEAPADLIPGSEAMRLFAADPDLGTRLVHGRRRVIWEAK